MRLPVICLLLALARSAAADVAPEPPEPAPRAVEGYHLPPDQYRRAVAHARAGYRLYFLDAAYGFAALALILRARVAARYRSLAERASKRRFVQLLIFIPLFALTLAILTLPLSIYGHRLQLEYDQSVQRWGSWLWDWIKGNGITIILGIVFAWILYAVIRRSPRRWWLYFWLSAVPIVIFLQFIAPVIVEPLFFNFTPLADQHAELAGELGKVAARGGLAIPGSRMYEMQASEKLKSLNAYVSGIGASKRVVVWDTTMAKMTTPEIMFVFGHELGHYVLGHIPRSIAFALALLLLFLYLGYRVMNWAIKRWGPRWDIRDAADFSSLPLLLLCLSTFGFVATPIESAFSRYQEHEADVYGLAAVTGLVRDAPQAAAGAFQVLGEVDLGDPDPPRPIVLWLYSHPPISDRIDFVLRAEPAVEKR